MVDVNKKKSDHRLSWAYNLETEQADDGPACVKWYLAGHVLWDTPLRPLPWDIHDGRCHVPVISQGVYICDHYCLVAEILSGPWTNYFKWNFTTTSKSVLSFRTAMQTRQKWQRRRNVNYESDACKWEQALWVYKNIWPNLRISG